MKAIFFIIAGLYSMSLNSQSLSDSLCSQYRPDIVKAFIVEAKDSTINASILKRGINIYLSDTTYKIVGFCIGYDFFAKDSTVLYSLCSDKNYIEPNEANYYLRNIENSQLLIVEDIRVKKGNVCFKAKSIIYNVIKE